jgi:UTP-glucose-1-phosphate uridylyltransferase
MKPTLLILAAGLGSRYGGLKQVDPIGPNGEAIIDYSIYDAIRAGYGKVVFVIRESFAEAFKETFDSKLRGRIETAYAYQELDSFVPKELTIHPDRKKPWGTGHAILVAKDVVHEPFVVINADDFYGSAAYRMIPEFLSGVEKHDIPHYCMVGYQLKNTLSEHGFVSRGICETDGEAFLKTVVERTHIEKSDGKIFSQIDENTSIELTGNEVVSMNIWGFTPSYFGFLETYFNKFIRENVTNPKGEFYIPYVVNELINRNEIKLKVLESKDHWFGVTYKEDKEMAVNSIRNLISKGIYPEKLWK